MVSPLTGRVHHAPTESIPVFDRGKFSATPLAPEGLRPTQEGERAISSPRSVERSAAFEGS